MPVAGDTFTILSASFGISGQFASLVPMGMPPGLTFKLTYGPNSVIATVVAGTQYDVWIASFPSLNTAELRLKSADPDGDGLKNIAEFALAGAPTVGGPVKIFPKIAPVAGTPAFTVTFPVRVGGGNYAVGPKRVTDPEQIFILVIQASDDLVSYPMDTQNISDADAAAIQTALPPVGNGWYYMTLRSPGPVAGDPREFVRLWVEY